MMREYSPNVGTELVVDGAPPTKISSSSKKLENKLMAERKKY